ncbi:ABC transporter substrate-binding protein [Azospirillum argentinense]|uniref:ABC transporter substrate-binding protein n=1 Tax=Azospirillum argentinense TaxID=2970906 RepID=A0A060DGW1_9PROT|nr:ABC transporter substrate-binding protein [Azospirillum argentinense]AIB12112.1 ABC transporter substrate-binding protein [Azospirillum argentinense]EZQ08974.1 ABC transporter substrate-binding protein [Azospirillum argentinense]
MRRFLSILSATVFSASLLSGAARAGEASVPVLVPLTGFLSLEGTSQRNGAVLALKDAPAGVAVRSEVIDTGTSPEAAVTALERAAGGKVTAVAASMLGTQMLAMLPLAQDYGIPLVTVSGTASITEQGNPWVFRFFPGDAVTKEAHARYVTEELGKKRPAVIYQTTAYGQSGKAHLEQAFKKLGVEPVFEEGVDPAAKDLLPVLTKALAAKPDVLVLHLHSGPTALFIRQAAANGVAVPIVAGSAMHQPSTAALLEPAELKGVCAETAASPISGGNPEVEAFTAAYRAAFNAEPDAFALGQYDGIRMVLAAVQGGAENAEAVRKALSGGTHQGLAMTYRSDGKGNMAHSAVIVCYDGASRVPAIAKRYDNLTGVVTGAVK